MRPLSPFFSILQFDIQSTENKTDQLYATSLVQLYDLVSPHVLILRTRKKTANVSGYILEIQNFRIKNV